MNVCSPKTVAKILDVDRSTAYRWMRNGVLPAFELQPGQWRYYEEALERFIRNKARKMTRKEEPAPTETNWPSAERFNCQLSAHQADNKGAHLNRQRGEAREPSAGR
jgi:excisionase family DNA binding protein